MSVDESIMVVLAGRAGVYRLCQNLFGNEQTAESLQMIAGAPSREVLGLFAQISEEFCLALDAFTEILEKGMQQEDAFVKSLSVAYTRLFVGPGNVEAPPWESIYYGSERVLFTSSTLEVRKAYVAQELIPSEYPHVADDHIGIELDFMACLAQRMVEYYTENNLSAVKKPLAASIAFLDEHLLTWIPAFSAALEEAAHGSFYREAAILLLSFLKIDRAMLDEIQESLWNI